MRTVTFYTRAGCHLCEDALRVLERVRREIPFELCEVDIEADDRLHRIYLERIPVVEIDGREQFAYFVEEGDLRRELGASGLETSPRWGAEDPLESGR